MGALCGQRCVIDEAADIAGQLLASHAPFLIVPTAAVNSIGIDLHAHRFRVEVIEMDLKLERVLFRIDYDLQVAKAQLRPFAFQGVPPFDQSFADAPLPATR